MLSLLCVGAMDMVSVVVRGTRVQLAPPDEMRGRVNAVEMIFIGASNEVGQFESGLTAQWLGAVPAVVLGGIGTLIVTALCAGSFPELRRVDQIPSIKSYQLVQKPVGCHSERAICAKNLSFWSIF